MASVLYASTKNIVLTSVLNGAEIDGFVMKVGDRILVKDQLVPVQNGIYIIGASKHDTKRDPHHHNTHASAQQFIVKYGNKNKNSGWICINSGDADIYGLDEIYFTQFFGYAVDGNIVGPNVSTADTVVLWNGTNTIKTSTIKITDKMINGLNQIIFPGAKLQSLGTSSHNCNIPALTQDATLVTENNTQTLTNKTISSPTNVVGATELRTNGASVRIGQSDPPQTGHFLRANSSSSATWQPFHIGDIGKISILSDSKSAGSNGGTALVENTWFTRDLNTIKGNMPCISLGQNNIFTISCGKYHIEASAPAYLVRSNQIRLYNISGGYTEMFGTSEFSPYSQTRSFLYAYIDVCEDTSYKIEHIVQIGGQNTDLGVATGFGTENYTLIKIVKME